MYAGKLSFPALSIPQILASYHSALCFADGGQVRETEVLTLSKAYDMAVIPQE